MTQTPKGRAVGPRAKPRSLANGKGQTGTPRSLANGKGQTGTPRSLANGKGQTGTPRSHATGKGQTGTPRAKPHAEQANAAMPPELSIRHYAGPGGEYAAQLRKPNPNEFTPEKQEAFFAHLSETANNAASAREAGISPETARTWRRNNADFRARWERSLAEGHADLQMKLLAVALFGSTSTTVTTWNDAGAKTVKRTGDHPEIMIKLARMNEVAVEAARVREAEELRIAGQPPLEKIWTLIDQMRSRGAARLEAPSSKAGEGAGEGGDDGAP